MNGETPEAIHPIAKLVEFQQEQALVTQANATPLPGALRDAFAIVPEITVGPYKVRPIVDRDWEYLQSLDHPLHKHINGTPSIGEMITGKYAWQLCYMFTHPFPEIKALLKKNGLDGFKTAAENDFETLNLAQLIEITKAVMQQVEIYWEPVIGHVPADGEDSKKNTLVDGTDNPATASVLPLKSVAS